MRFLFSWNFHYPLFYTSNRKHLIIKKAFELQYKKRQMMIHGTQEQHFADNKYKVQQEINQDIGISRKLIKEDGCYMTNRTVTS